MSERTYRFPIEIIEALHEYKQQKRRKSIYDDVITDYLIEYFGRIEHPYMSKYPEVFARSNSKGQSQRRGWHFRRNQPPDLGLRWTSNA